MSLASPFQHQAEAGPSRLGLIFTASPSPHSSPPPADQLKRKRERNALLLSPSASSSDDDPDFSLVSPPASSSLRGGGKPRAAKRRPPGVDRRVITRSQAHSHRPNSPTLSTDLESIAIEDRAVRSEIGRLGLGLRDVQGDGNCLFRAVADQLWGVQKRHSEVRKLVCDYLEGGEGRRVMEPFVGAFMREDEGYEGYVERMRQLKQFGSHIEIQAAARVFRRSIRVIMSTTSFTIPFLTESSTHPSTPAPPTPSEPPQSPSTLRRHTRSSTSQLLSTPSFPPPSDPAYASALADYIPPIRPGRSMLWLALFSQAEHFQSVRRKGDGDSGPAEVEDRLAVPHKQDTSEAARRERGEAVPSDKAKGGVPDGKVQTVLASLPVGHTVSASRAEGVLARVKGDVGEAVEILLEELQHEEGVEQLLQPDGDAIMEGQGGEGDGEYRESRTKSTSPSSERSGSEGTEGTRVTTPSERSGGKDKEGGLENKLGLLEVASGGDLSGRPSRASRGGRGRGRGRGRGTGRGRGRARGH